MLIDTPTNTKIIYLYVKDFQWTIPINKESNVGHPKSGRVYRGIINTDTESYRLMYRVGDAIQGTLLPQLDSQDEANGYLSDIREITINNILDFDILEEDLTELLRWLETDNKELKDKIKGFFDKQQPNPSFSLPPFLTKKSMPEMVVEILRSRDPELASIVSTVNELRVSDPHIFDAVGAFINHLLSHPEAETSIDSRWIRFDKNLGAGANLSAALSKLSVYGSNNRRTGFSEHDLVGAIRDLLLEEYRWKLHENE